MLWKRRWTGGWFLGKAADQRNRSLIQDSQILISAYDIFPESHVWYYCLVTGELPVRPRVSIARSDYRVDPSRWSKDVQIVGGTPHTIALKFDPQCVRRIAAKIAYALFCSLTKGRIERAEDRRMRRYILGTGASQDEPVSVAPEAPTSTTSSDPHYIVLSPTHDRTATFVNLYIWDFRVELGANGSLPEPIVIVCNIDGTGMRIGSQQDLLTATARIATKKFSQPWLQSPTG
jgi:hypothetical protein